MYILTNKLYFPSVETADDEGLLAIGGDLTEERLLLAYQSGIFPWYEGDVILWWSPNPRFVLFPNELIVSKTMQQVFRRKVFTYTYNSAFTEVIKQCKNLTRKGQEGTWITDAMRDAYINLHRKGYAISAEAWQYGKLVGGLYGILQGNIFCGESMFATVSNASKFAFISLVQQLKTTGIQLIDCQVHTNHLESLGGRMIERKTFLSYL